MPLILDYKSAHAAGWDAGNRSMQAGGRTSWNDDDYMAAVIEFNRLAVLAALETKEKVNA